MENILKKVTRFLKTITSIIITFILSVVYLILFFPFAVFIKIYTDYLEIKRKSPCWSPHGKLKDIKEFLAQQ